MHEVLITVADLVVRGVCLTVIASVVYGAIALWVTR